MLVIPSAFARVTFTLCIVVTLQDHSIYKVPPSTTKKTRASDSWKHYQSAVGSIVLILESVGLCLYSTILTWKYIIQ